MFKIRDTTTGIEFGNYATRFRAEAYVHEWAVKAGRTDLVVVEV